MGILYPGFAYAPGEGRIDLQVGDLRPLDVSAGDLVSFRQLEGLTQLWLMSGFEAFDDILEATSDSPKAWHRQALDAAIARAVECSHPRGAAV